MNDLSPLLVAGFGSDTAVLPPVLEPRVITHNPTDVDPLLPPSSFQSNITSTNDRRSEVTVPEELWHLVPHRDEGGYTTSNDNGQTSTIDWSDPEVVTRTNMDHSANNGRDYTFV